MKGAGTPYHSRPKGTRHSPAPNRKLNPGYQATVAAYRLLNTAKATLELRLSRNATQANSAPAGQEVKDALSKNSVLGTVKGTSLCIRYRDEHFQHAT